MKGIRSWDSGYRWERGRGLNWERQKEVLPFGLSGDYVGEFTM